MMTIAVLPKEGVHPDDAVDELRGILRRVRKVKFGEPDNFGINRIDVLEDLYRKLTGGLYARHVRRGQHFAGRRWHWDHEHHARVRHRADQGDRHSQGAGRQTAGDPTAVPDRGDRSLHPRRRDWHPPLGFGIASLIDALSPVPASVQPWSVTLGLGFSAAIGLVFGVVPARRAAAKNPIESLRYE